MKKIFIILLTLSTIAFGNWASAFALQLAFLDIAIPFAGLALALVYFFKSKGGMTSRRLDMSIQGQTGIRMEQKVHVSERSYIFIGSVLYFVLALGFTFYTYREYFLT
ncbi:MULTISPECIES: hypothetical protein [Planococcus]|uniref:DUF3899 domain-containing protein n=2 Tax=Planococcus TaxID=1372 RepID=A0ABM5WYH3_9BACL|nr:MULTISPECIES: hypothetical protein [Planococcus]ALS78500.1 hypothetical protein AUO94_07430 [Planococcus kocurii]AQU79510.1 hypothetical protein AJGP001_09660 [Planococcus faecalis]MDJ0332902.1 hypothetical protein [Planococcus sp. S3-L1]OHX51943.1 hypothetical protein BB777_14360 [Planococcus faecalis]